MRLLSFVFLLSMLISCNNPQFYSEIEKVNGKKLNRNSIFRKHLNKYSKELKNTTKIVYYTSTRLNIEGKVISFHSIYDIEKEMFYSCNFINTKKVFHEKSNKVSGEHINKNLKFFMEGKCDSVKTNVEEFNNNISVLGSNVVLFYIDIINRQKSYKCNSDSDVPH